MKTGTTWLDSFRQTATWSLRLEPSERYSLKKRVVVAFLPSRYSFALNEISRASLHIGRRKITKSLLPPVIQKPDGTILNVPIHGDNKVYNMIVMQITGLAR